jgi:hypothetical protein
MVDFVHLSELHVNSSTDSLYLLSNNPERLNQYFNIIRDFNVGLSSQLRWMKIIKNQAVRLLDFLDEKGFR